MTWQQIAAEAGLPADHREFTTVTRKVRRVGRFDSEIVRSAIQVNHPDHIVLNHLDYVDARVHGAEFTERACRFLKDVEARIGREVYWLGTGPATVIERRKALLTT
jgi:adenylosuccinate synthase